MGASSVDTAAQEDEKPPHAVFLDAFYIDQYEVTASRYAKFMNETGRSKPKYWDLVQLSSQGDRPVVGVTWNDAKAYCQYYNKRLPTEAEWEKAARGTDGRIYPWGNDPPTPTRTNFNRYDASWGTDLYSERLKPVGSYDAGKSPSGAYDMAGNVWEWVADWYDVNYYRNSPKQNPKGPQTGGFRVLRGGSWGDVAVVLRASDRLRSDPPYWSTYVGFRCAKDAR